MPKKKAEPMAPFPANMNARIIIDSGAFTAWTKGTEVDINQYADFCLEYLDHLNMIVSLDVIPGAFGDRSISMKEMDRAANKGWENYHHLLERGIPEEKLLHVFHQGEDFKWLEKIRRHTYIGISPANDRTTPDRAHWLDECMKYIVEDGKPTTKFHGLAVTSLKLIFRYPWYSVDSASWRRMGAYGKIYFPTFKNGEFSWGNKSEMIILSERQKNHKQNYNNFYAGQQERIREFVEKHNVVDFDEMLASKPYPRDVWNSFYFIQVQKALGRKVFFAATDYLTLPSVLRAAKAAEQKTINVLFSHEYLKPKSSQRLAFENIIEKEKPDESRHKKFTRRIN